MEPKDLTIPLIVSWGGAEVFNEGLRLSQRHGEVTSNWDPVNHVIYGEIMEDADWSRPVRFELLDDGSVRSHCLCPQNQQWGKVCKHVVAVGLHLMVKYQKDEEERAAAASGTRVAIPPEALATKEAPVNVAIVAEYFEDEGQFALFPQADLPEGVEHILSQDRYFVSGERGYVLAAGRWYPIRRVLSGPFQAVYREDQFISREAMPAFIRNNLPILRRQVEVRMSPSEDMFTFLPDKPQMRAKIFGSTTSALSVEVLWRGDGAAVRASRARFRMPSGPRGHAALPCPQHEGGEGGGGGAAALGVQGGDAACGGAREGGAAKGYAL